MAVVVFAALVAVYFPLDALGLPSNAEARLRWLGFVLQLGGLLTVVLGLERSRQLFQLPAAWTAALGWLRDFPKIFKRPERVTGSATVMLPPLIASGRTFAPHISTSLLDRVYQLEKQVAELAQKFDRDMSEIHRSISAELSRHRTLIEEAEQRQAAKLRKAVVDDTHWELIGVGLVVVGTVCGSIPEELAIMLF